MAAFTLDDVVQRVLLEGDDQILSALEKIADKGGEFFEDLAKAAKGGDGSFAALATAIGAAESALAAATAAMIAFIENQDAAIVNLSAMAQAFGTTTTSMQGIEGAFAAAGIASSNMARVVQRVATSIGSDWAEIKRNIQNSSLESQKSMISMQEAALHVAEAQDQLARGGTERASQAVHDVQSIRSANLGLEEAQNRLNASMGLPVNPALKQLLDMRNAQLAVEKARQAVIDANNKAIEDSIKADRAEAAEILAVRNAQIAQSEAALKSHEADLRDIPKIVNAINALGTAAKGSADGINVAEVSVSNLVKGLIAASAQGAVEPTGFDVLKKLADTFQADSDHVISNSERLAVAMHLAGGTIRNAFGPELVRLLENGGDQFERMTQKAEAAGLAITESDITAAREFRSALTELGVDLELTKDKLAAAASPVFTAFLHEVDSSLTSSTGVLHLFVEGIKGIGEIVSGIGSGIAYIGSLIDKAFGEGSGLIAGKILLTALLAIVGYFAAPILAWPVIIAMAVVALGAVHDKMDGLKTLFTTALDSIRAGFAAVGNFIAGGWITLVESAVNKLLSKLGFIGKALRAMVGGGATEGASATAPIPALAGGGHIRGPGTGTSDSILARVSDGEHITRAAAVAHYGSSFMDAINNMTLPAFAMGGFVGAPQRMAQGGLNSSKPGATLNLSIDGEHFNGLHAPEDVASRLQTFAITRQMSSAGRAPGWKA